MPEEPPIHDRRFAELSAAELYALLRLRSEVFVVEQACAYLDADGRDVEAGTRHCWIEVDGEVAACLRIMDEPEGGSRVGRVVTDPRWRKQGLGRRLVAHAVATAASPIVLDAQAPQADWYRRFGFEVCGEPFDEDGILHVPMIHWS